MERWRNGELDYKGSDRISDSAVCSAQKAIMDLTSRSVTTQLFSAGSKGKWTFPRGASTPSPKTSNLQQGPERMILFGSVNEEVINKEIPQWNEHNEIGSQGDKTEVIPGRKDKPKGAPKVSSTTCKPIATDPPKIELPRQKI